MRRSTRAVITVVVTFALVLWAQIALADHKDSHDPGNDKITICHATGSETNPYSELTLSENAVYGPGGHFNENGTTQAGHEDDIFGPCPTEPDVTTTTVVEETTTTTSPAPEQPTTTTTSIPFDESIPTTTVGQEVTTTTVAVPTTQRTELPYTGLDPLVWLSIAVFAAAFGGAALVASRKR